MSPSFTPKRSIEDCDRILCAQGGLLEMEEVEIGGRLLRVYKHQDPNLRTFWLKQVETFADRTYVVFEDDRYTYRQLGEKASLLADVYRRMYCVRKGDRVGIAMRNLPEFLIAFWACHILGAVSTCFNAMMALDPFLTCLRISDCKLLIVDPERADSICSSLPQIRRSTCLNGVLVVRGYEVQDAKRQTRWMKQGIANYEDALFTGSSQGGLTDWSKEPACLPEDDATIFFTSGTTGPPKGVLSTQRSFGQNVLNTFVASLRAILRRGEAIPGPDPEAPQPAVLIAVPLFHVTGCTSIMMSATANGAKIVLIRKWNTELAVELIKSENVNSTGGVPSIIMDLLDSSLAHDPEHRHRLQTLSSGGAAPPENMIRDALRRFPNAVPASGYGLSETNAIACTLSGEDYVTRPNCAGLPVPNVDVKVVDPLTNEELPINTPGELLIRGSNLMRGYWRDPEATAAAITPDGWLKSGDVATIDAEGFVYICDRAKDIIIRGGENIHSIEVENALYADDRILDAAAIAIKDRRLGELVAAVVAPKAIYMGELSEDALKSVARRRLPPHAVPVMILISDQPLDVVERNPTGKIMKDTLRIQAREAWAVRQRQGQLKANM